MGTRSVIVVSGLDRHGREQVVRLYRHFDGYPQENLQTIVKAIEFSKGLQHYDTSCKRNIPARTMADVIIAQSIDWFGSSVVLDGDPRQDYRKAIYSEPLAEHHYGDQGDIEWVYLVECETQRVTVWSGGCGSPDEHFATGPVDPRIYAKQLMKEHQGECVADISQAMDRIQEAGWSLTQPTAKKPRKRVGSVK
jgi:hypothetical protein